MSVKEMLRFKLIPREDITSVAPLVALLNEGVSLETIKNRLLEMCDQNYECVGVFVNDELIGCAGLWIQTRHYSGRCLEPDHVIIKPEYQNQQIGERLFDFFVSYAQKKGCEVTELNCYLRNPKGQAFWEKLGYKKLGYHYLLKLDLP